jgi:hypothetical protein
MSKIGSDVIGKTSMLSNKEQKTKITRIGIIKELKLIPISEIQATESQWKPLKLKGKFDEDKTPPVEVLGKRFPNDKYLLVDGHHRFNDAKNNGIKQILAWVTRVNSDGTISCTDKMKLQNFMRSDTGYVDYDLYEAIVWGK